MVLILSLITNLACSKKESYKSETLKEEVISAENSNKTEVMEEKNNSEKVNEHVYNNNPKEIKNTSKIDNKKVNISNNINNTKEKAGTKTKNDKENDIQKNVVKEDDKKETKQIETQQKITYKDGIYIGSSEGKNGEIKVQVTVKDGRIHIIEILSHSDTQNLFEIVYKKIASAVYEKQSAEVEIVSGATLTSNGLIRAISNALEGANNSK